MMQSSPASSASGKRARVRGAQVVHGISEAIRNDIVQNANFAFNEGALDKRQEKSAFKKSLSQGVL